MSYFSDIIGQTRAKKQLGFFIDAHRSCWKTPNILLGGEKGNGKTLLAKTFAKNLLKQDKSDKKPTIEVNCSTIGNVTKFINDIYIPHIQDKEATLILDEASELPNSVTMALLSLLNPNRNGANQLMVGGSMITFDFEKLSVLFCTTDPQQMNKALIDRCELVDLEPYNQEELLQIVRLSLVKNGVSLYNIEDFAGQRLATTLRGNARAAQKMADKIKLFLDSKIKTNFSEHDLEEFVDKLGIYPLGLTSIEYKILQYLAIQQNCSLTMLSAKTGVPREALQKYYEIHLMRMGLIHVGQNGRNLTTKGADYLRNAKV